MIAVLLLSALLVAWALHLMQQAADRQEFSLMLAGTLVAASAAGLVVVYSLGNSSLSYLLQVDLADYGQVRTQLHDSLNSRAMLASDFSADALSREGEIARAEAWAHLIAPND